MFEQIGSEFPGQRYAFELLTPIIFAGGSGDVLGHNGVNPELVYQLNEAGNWDRSYLRFGLLDWCFLFAHYSI